MEHISDSIEIAGDDVESINDDLYDRGLTDGLPVVPPTPDRVEQMLGASNRDPDAKLGAIPPRYGEVAVETLAINAVMAGCKPEYMPVLEAAVEALTEERFNLYGINATTHPVAPLLVVSGPVIDELDINYGYNVFGQGQRSNSTIGRAIRLLLVNAGGGKPGVLDRATHGHPGKFSFCIAENEARTPWDPLHVQRGHDENQSAVTVIGAESPHEINDHVHDTAEGILNVTADVLATVGNNNSHHSRGQVTVVFGPEHAETIARSGWSREDVQWYLYDQARNSAGQLRTAGIYDNYTLDQRFHSANDQAQIPLVEKPEDIITIVSGGAGKHSMALHSFGETRAVTKPVGEGSER